MQCTECGTAEGVIERVYVVHDRRAETDGSGGPRHEASLGPLRLCEGCWQRRRAAFLRGVQADWRAHVATVRPSAAGTAASTAREGRRLDGGDTGMRL